MPADGPRSFRGQPAAPGLAEGPVALWRPAGSTQGRPVGSPDEEAARFAAALEQATTDLTALSAAGDAMAGEILEFQIMLLEDDDLLDPVWAAVAGGAGAAAAWSAHLDGEIAEYASAEDDYLAARASDLADLRDRVLGAFSDGGGGQELAEGAVVWPGTCLPPSFSARIGPRWAVWR